MTSRYAIFGNPVAHSLSPDIHAFFARGLGDDISYGRVLVPDGEFDRTAREFFAEGSGCNVTVPCKGDAFKFAGSLSEHARIARAVNTLKRMDDGTIYGDNTDGRGFAADLKFKGIAVKGARILILGAGGAARGILKPLIDEDPASVTVANRTFSKARDLEKLFGGPVEASELSSLKGGYDIVVNATSASLSGTVPEVGRDVIGASGCACDLMYRKGGHTVFTDFAQQCGCPRVFDGLGMLVMQAALSYELWRGRMPDYAGAYRHFGGEA
ncbi:MAG: shikimate dehydrogenase [Succinivibrio sp.]